MNFKIKFGKWRFEFSLFNRNDEGVYEYLTMLFYGVRMDGNIREAIHLDIIDIYRFDGSNLGVTLFNKTFVLGEDK